MSNDSKLTDEEISALSARIVDHLMQFRPKPPADDPTVAALKTIYAELNRTNRTLDAILDALSR